ncbi:protein of unknown function [Bacillus velezensis UCMB5033]|nr:protein of unknown function [Bacillus velezensis UCMB5113]CDG30636.1 protein of unknown function [Bacillus velezensis UCMB5033]
MVVFMYSGLTEMRITVGQAASSLHNDSDSSGFFFDKAADCFRMEDRHNLNRFLEGNTCL